MVNRLLLATILVTTCASAQKVCAADTFTFFGSIAGESDLTPANEESPLNRNNVAGIPYRNDDAETTFVAEVKPDSRAWRFHLKAHGESSDHGRSRLELSEGFIQVSVASWLDITAGRSIEKWGTGYAWNPTAFVSPPKDPTDPEDRNSALQGMNMIRADLSLRGTSVSLYALDHGAWAARAYRLVRGVDFSVALHHDAKGTEQGISAARAFGNALELHAELARRRLLLGGQYTFPGGINVIVEGYRSGDGLTSAEWSAFRGSIDETDPRSVLAANLAYHPLQMGRNYGFVRVDCPTADQKLDLEVVAIASLRDGSSILRVTLSRKLRATVSAYVIETEFLGGAQSEMGFSQVKRQTTVGARYSF